MAAIEDAEGTATKTFSELTFGAGATSELDLVNGLRRPVTLAPTAVAQHVYEDGILTGTQVVVSLNISDETRLNEIEKLEMKITKGGTEYRQFNKTSGFSVEEEIGSSNGKLYLPQGTYDLDYTYKCDEKEVEGNTTFIVSAPDLSLNSSHTVKSLTVTLNASINISENVLNEYPISSWIVILKAGGIEQQTWESSNSDLNSSNFISNQSFTSKEGENSVIVSLLFDDVSIEVKDSYNLVLTSFRKSDQPVQFATDLKSGSKYIIRVKGDGSFNKRYWSLMSSYESMSLYNLNDDLTSIDNTSFVFEYYKDDTKGRHGSYDHETAGTWKSLKTGQYLSSDLKFNKSINDAMYLIIANHYSTDPSGYKNQYMEFYQADNTSGGVLYTDKKGGFLWGTSDFDFKKWEIIEVFPQ